MQQVIRESISKANQFILHMGVIPNKNRIIIDRKRGVILDDGEDVTQKLKNIWENAAYDDITYRNENTPCGALVYDLFLDRLDAEYIDKWLTNGTLVSIGKNHAREVLLSIGIYPHIDQLPLTDKNKDIIKRFICGENLKTIGQRYGIGAERVRQIVAMGKRHFVNQCFASK